MHAKVWAFLRRDFQTQVSYRLNFVMRIGGMLITLATFYFISQILGTAIDPNVLGYITDYFHFALIGIAFFPFIRISANSMSEVIGEYQGSGTLEILLVSRTPILTTLIMSTLWQYCWALAESLVYLLVAALVFQADIQWGNIALAVPILCAGILSNIGLGFINAGFVLVTKRPSPLVPLLGLLTNLLAGRYYPIEVLPAWLRIFSYLLPATYSFNALRHILLQGAQLNQIWQYLAVLIGFTVVLLPLGLVALRYAIHWAKVDGSLAQY